MMKGGLEGVDLVGGLKVERGEGGGVLIVGGDVRMEGIEGLVLVEKDMGGLVLDEGVGLVDVVKVGVVVGVVKKVEGRLIGDGVAVLVGFVDGGVEMLVDEGEEGEVGDSVEDGGGVGCVDVGEGNEVVFREEERVVKDVVV